MLCCCDALDPLSPEEVAAQEEIKEVQKADGDRSVAETVDSTPPVATSEQIVSVTIPEGVHPGQTLTVRSPTGAQSVTATVPEGMIAGDSFLVRFPPISELDGERTDPPDASREVAASNEETRGEEQEVKHTPSLVDVIEDMITPTPDVVEMPKEKVEESVEENVEENVDDPEPEPTPLKQKLLLVQVPQGIPPGSTIHVEIPGEFRTLAAQVPPGATSFHVAYTPQVVMHPQMHQQQFQQMYQPPRQPQPQPMMAPPQQAHSTLVRSPSTLPGQKLLLVRVPPGTTAGSTLHVSVPDEPGRILAAQVPMGGVREFHVSYEPRFQPTPSSRSMLTPANPYTGVED